MANEPKPVAKPALTRLQKIALALLGVLFLGSVAARAMLLSRTDPPTSNNSSTLQPASYLASTRAESSAPATEGTLEAALPYLTEGSLFALLGFALGYTTRKIFKIGLIVIALAFVVLQALSYAKVATVDWGGLVDWLNGAILNLKENETVTQFFTRRIPSTGALIAGVFVGFQRG